MLLVKGFRENAHIIAVRLLVYRTVCQRIETTWSLVDVRNRNILVSSVKHLNLPMLKLYVQTTDNSDHGPGGLDLLVPTVCCLLYTYVCLV